jgi:hypothetical protein
MVGAWSSTELPREPSNPPSWWSRQRRHLPQIEAFDHYSQALVGFVTSEEG